MSGSVGNRALIVALAVAFTGACETGTEPEKLGPFEDPMDPIDESVLLAIIL